MLDPETPDERREQIAADARNRIESGGSLKHDTAWGTRKLAFEIQRRTEADYRFFRFEAGGSPLLDELNHNLKIADGVLRFRIFKVDPRTPVIVPPPPTPLSSGRPERGGRRGDGPPRGRGDGPRGRSDSADSEPVAAPAAEAEAPEAPPAEAPEATPPEAPEPAAPEAPDAPPAEPESPEAPEAPPEPDAPAPAEDAPGDEPGQRS